MKETENKPALVILWRGLAGRGVWLQREEASYASDWLCAEAADLGPSPRNDAIPMSQICCPRQLLAAYADSNAERGHLWSALSLQTTTQSNLSLSLASDKTRKWTDKEPWHFLKCVLSFLWLNNIDQHEKIAVRGGWGNLNKTLNISKSK